MAKLRMELTPASIPYQIKVTKRAKHISLKVDHRGLVIVSPKRLSPNEITKLFDRHSIWISKHKKYIFRTQVDNKIKHGSIITLLGTDIEIVVTSDPTISKIVRTTNNILVPESRGIELLYKWLRLESKQYILRRVNDLADRHNFNYSSVSVRDQSTRWGSCSGNKNLNFSWRLALAPLYVLDYVIIHELAHTKEMNHSSKFWEVVESVIPNYNSAKSWLKTNGYKLHLY